MYHLKKFLGLAQWSFPSNMPPLPCFKQYKRLLTHQAPLRSPAQVLVGGFNSLEKYSAGFMLQ